MLEMNTSYLVIGAGRCGLGLAGAMHSAGMNVTGIVSRSATSRRRARRLLPALPVSGLHQPLPPASCYLLAVADDVLTDVAAAVAAAPPSPSGWVALHTSGLHPSSALAPLRNFGAAVGSFHPLFAFPPPSRRPPALRGALAAIEGDPAAVRLASALARQLGLKPHRLAVADKALYHAAATVAGNLTHVLIALGREMLLRIGFSAPAANAALTPLVRASCGAALAASGLEHLTGPLARGDVRTVDAHLAILPGDVAAAYRAVAAAALPRLASAPDPPCGAASALATTLTPSFSCASVPLMPYGEDG